MNYTENYHLPQWDEDDRILRTDFNRMCADMESGLCQNAQAAADASSQGGALGDKTFSQLCRMAYNHLRTLWELEAAPQQWGAFREKTPSSLKWAQSVSKQEAFRPVGRWKETPTAEALYQMMEQTSALHLEQGNNEEITPLIINFNPSGGGTLPYLPIKGRYDMIQPYGKTPYKLTFTDLDTGKIEYQKSDSFNFLPQSSAPTVPIPIEFLFHSGHHYQIKLTPQVADITADFSLVGGDHFQPSFFHTGSVSYSHTFREDESGEGGTFLVCCGSYGAGGNISLTLNGEELPVYQTRTYLGSRNDPVVERIYRKPEHIPGGSTLQLNVTANPGGDLTLYGWGGALL